MALRSALDDFEGTTLAAIPGLLGKLQYIAELHDGHGNYLHWGMGRVHGDLATRRAIGTSHAAVLTRVLRTPLRVLAEDLNCSAETRQFTPGEFLASLEKKLTQALLDRPMASSDKHLRAILHALSALLQS